MDFILDKLAAVSLADIADLLGHKDLATTQNYAKVQQEDLADGGWKADGLVPAPEIDDASPKRDTHTPIWMPRAALTCWRQGTWTMTELGDGEEGIRTPGSLSTSTVFKTAALNHSATSPHWTFLTNQSLRRAPQFTTGAEILAPDRPTRVLPSAPMSRGVGPHSGTGSA